MKTLAKLSIIGGVLIVVLSGSAEAGGFKVKSLGKFQQKALAKVAGGVAGAYVGTAVTPVAGRSRVARSGVPFPTQSEIMPRRSGQVRG